MEWQPMETAPMDGKPILGCQGEGEDYTVFEMVWMMDGYEGWWDPRWDGRYSPIAWMPRPAPPDQDHPTR